jgi:hypothetical protein
MRTVDDQRKNVILAISPVFFLLLSGVAFASANRYGSGTFFAMFGVLLVVGVVLLWRVGPKSPKE